MLRLPLVCCVLAGLLALASLEGLAAEPVRIGMIVAQNDPFYTAPDEAFAIGVSLFSRWVNEHEEVNVGDPLNDLTLEVIIYNATNGSTPEEKAAKAADLLLSENVLDIFFAPFALSRVLAVLPVWAARTNQTIPLFSPAGVSPQVWKTGYTNIWHTSAGTPEFSPTPVETVLNRVQQSVTINLVSKKLDSFWVTVYDAVLSLLVNGTVFEYPAGVSHPPTTPQQYVEWSRITEDLTIVGADDQLALDTFIALTVPLRESNAELLIIMGVEGLEASIYNPAIAAMELNPSAIIAPKPINIIDSGFLQGKAPDSWIFTALFHKSLNRGVSGQYMGTTQEFLNYYEQVYQEPLSDAYITYTPSQLISWQIAVERCGLDWRNATCFKEKMFGLRADDNATEYFSGRIQYDPFGRNIARQSLTVQYVDGSLNLILSPEDLVYPAHWPWIGSDGTGSETSMIVGLTVGIVGGVAVILGCCGIIAVVVFLIVKRRYFHMIILAKEKPI